MRRRSRGSAFRRASILAATLLFVLAAWGCDGGPAGDSVLLATGTTVQDSGLLDALTTAFEDATGYNLRAVSVGTGQALAMGRRGDVDVLFAHDPVSERAFLEQGAGVNRRLVMYNDFVIAGPPDDPAGVRDALDAAAALRAIAGAAERFISRGDDSGTHALELRLWKESDLDPSGEAWYAQAGQGMASTLQVADQRRAYTIADRGTFLALRDNVDLDMVFEPDPPLLNVYHVMQVNPERHGDVNAAGAAAFVEFMMSDEAQAIIGRFGPEEFGRPLFVPAAGLDELAPP